MEPLGKRYQSLREAVADEIRGEILKGAISPGERLVEEELAHRFGVSRMPVREALSILEAEGFVEIVPRRGASVVVLTPEESLDLFEVRSSLEGLSARLAARRGSPEVFARLEAIVEEGKERMRSGQLELMPELHQRFHVTLAEAAANRYLSEILAPLPAKIEWIYATEIRERAPVSWPEHGEIVEAVRSGDEDLAEATIRRHVDRSAREFLAILEREAAEAPAPTPSAST